ncbi:two-component system osmolarity sensor histidine kinase EnvZ [Rhodovulum imhoffii]|uniref:histidine kinase n=1 Tax=Rhodovulum imhoffii TaxID=365340 RepID=A0A2T5BNY4_9RHOB|nr:ATP-binding protein [Rhodovulum imhoffii]MBK5932556.1 two-component sensor histidine kinase [Rhodovulum imhoffii]PTN00697.1 two-component system osmolarity sensor histidine kinase EnvZ [Rhodovulum imhoffii]
MSKNWIKRLLPRGLYGRAALILLVPVVTLQLVVSVVFLQRHFEDVTRQMTRTLVLEVSYLSEEVRRADTLAEAQVRIAELATPLGLNIRLPGSPVVGEVRVFYDISGRTVVATLREGVARMQGVDLAADLRQVRLGLSTRHGPMEVTFDRKRVSASNPHQLLVLMIFTGVLMTLIAFVFLRNQLRPIKRMAQAAEAFGKGRVLPYKPSGATEVRAAGRAFLDMRARIERQMEQRTLMLSGVSHDLRTPLTRLKLGLSMGDDSEDTRAMLRDLSEMEKMLETFLDFARADALDDPELTDPAVLLSGIVDKARRAGGKVDLGELPAVGKVMLRPLAVTRALDNLLGNALRYGTRARVSLQVKPRAVCFVVEDDGPGIPPDQRNAAIKPFLRLDAARNQNLGTGVGLGLAIASDIARGHGGVLRLEDSADLGGLRAGLEIAL